MRKPQPNWILRSATLLLLSWTLAGCAANHVTMRGSIVGVDEGKATVCIGSADGLWIGDMLSVYRTRQVGSSNLPYGQLNRGRNEVAQSFRYEKQKVGKVRVIAIVDEHFAVVEVLSGEADYPDIVERFVKP